MPFRRKEKILIVDDEKCIRSVLCKQLEALGYHCDSEPDGLRALQRTKGYCYDLVLLDVKMPYVSGDEILKGLMATNDNLPVMMISGIESVDTVRRTLRDGAFDYLVKPIDPEDLDLSVRRAIDHGCLLRKSAEYKRNLENQIAERTKELARALERIKNTYDATILALGSALETRDTETRAHGIRVAKYSLLIANRLGIEDRDHLTDIERGAYLHDIGKIGVPDHILRKPVALTGEEWKVMKRHPKIGKQMIEGIDFLKGSTPIVYSHHERYDGKGYPQGLSRQNIPIEARIFSVADALDGMISDRPYRAAFPLVKAKAIIISESGRQFDPSVVEAFSKIPERKILDRDIAFPIEREPLEIGANLEGLPA